MHVRLPLELLPSFVNVYFIIIRRRLNILLFFYSIDVHP